MKEDTEEAATKVENKEEDEGISIGHATFKKCFLHFGNDIMPRLEDQQEMYKLLCQKRWDLDKIFKICNIFVVLPYIISSSCRECTMNSKSQDMCLKSISHISFSNLHTLDLSSSGIVSIEAIAFIDCKNLRQLNLSQNQLTIFKPLVKMSCCELQNIDIWENKFLKSEMNRMDLIKLNLMRMDPTAPDYSIISQNLSKPKRVSAMVQIDHPYSGIRCVVIASSQDCSKSQSLRRIRSQYFETKYFNIRL